MAMWTIFFYFCNIVVFCSNCWSSEVTPRIYGGEFFIYKKIKKVFIKRQEKDETEQIG